MLTAQMARLPLLGLISLLMLAPIVAQSRVGRIAGQVIDGTTKAPIANARVTLSAEGRPTLTPPQVITDEDGRFAFEQLEPARYRVSATKGGFGFAPSMLQRPPIDLKAGANVDDVVWVLQPGAVITGHVVDAKGNPVVEVRVSFQPANRQPAPLMSGPGGQTNDLGEYRLYGLPEGEYYVHAGALIGFAPTSPMTSQLAPTYFPSSPDVASASVIRVRPGEIASNVDIRMDVQRLYQIHGIVVDERGRPVEGAVLSITPEQPSRIPVAFGPAQRIQSMRGGRFVIVNLPQGGYRLGAGVPIVASTSNLTGIGNTGPLTPNSFGLGNGMTSGGGPSIMSAMETHDGVVKMTKWRVDASQDIRVTVEDTDVTDVRIVALPPPQR